MDIDLTINGSKASYRAADTRLRRILFLTALSVLGLVATGCRKEPPALEIGFSRVAMEWRAGAKPGQVGTEALPEQSGEVVAMLQELLPILEDGRDDPEWLLYELTEWSIETLRTKTEELLPGRYAHQFEPGAGVELGPDVKAIVIRRGDETAAIVRADIYLMHEQLLRRVADLVEPRTGLSQDRIFLSGSHNHSAPHAISAAAGPWMMADAFDARQFVYVSRAIATAIVEAHEGLEPAVIRAMNTSFQEVQMNIIGSRTDMLEPPDGGDPVPVEVGYPRDHFDDDLTVIRFERPGASGDEDGTGEHLCSIFVLGMHPESLPSGHGITSGEWPIHVENRLEARHGGFFMWLPGALGDIEPDSGRLNPERDFWRKGFSAMHAMSEIIAGAVSSAWEKAGEEDAEARPLFAQIARDVPGPADYPMPDSTYLGGFRLPVPRILGDTTTIRLHLIRLGDVLLAGIPAETVTDLSWNIKSRVGVGHESVYQGHVFPDAPAWVRERVGRNFSTSVLPEEMRAKLPVVVNMTGGYVGYIVTRWEYENRDHYRQSLTTFGPGTADHVASAVVGLAREMQGDTPFETTRQPWHRADEEGFEMIASFLRSLDAEVTRIYSELPVSNPETIGSGSAEPVPGGSELRWRGGTNDLPVPSARLEAMIDGEWISIAEGPGAELWILFEPPDLWTARIRDPAVISATVSTGTSLRYSVEGFYRGDSRGGAGSDPIFDPDGADDRYSFWTEEFIWDP